MRLQGSTRVAAGQRNCGDVAAGRGCGGGAGMWRRGGDASQSSRRRARLSWVGREHDDTFSAEKQLPQRPCESSQPSHGRHRTPLRYMSRRGAEVSARYGAGGPGASRDQLEGQGVA